MRKSAILRWLSAVGLAVAGCGLAAPTPTSPPLSPSPIIATPAPTATAGRSAVLSDLYNDVRACPEAALAWEPAAEGQCIYAGGGVRTGQAARVRLDLSEGVIVRLAADTLFTLQSVSPAEDDLAARITLTAGQVWLAVTEALGFERLEVETPTGVATVRGSFMSVAYAPESGQMAVTCLEGACELASTAGSPVALTAGQQAEVPAAGQAPSPVQPMDSAQYAEWEQNCPETPAVPHILLSPGEGQCGQTTVPAGVVEFNFGVGRWPTADEARAAVDGSRPTISLDGQPLPVGDPTGPEWHTGGEPAGWGYSTRTRVTLEPGRYTLVSEWYWPDGFTCELTVSGR